MNTNISSNPPAPPSVMSALRAGFDAITNQMGILLFPITLDLVIWLGPHLGLKQLILRFFDQLSKYSGVSESPSLGLFEPNSEFINQVSERMNLMTLIRTYPVGVPSLMAGRQPLESPLDGTLIWGVPSTGLVLILGILLILVGLAAGTLYYQIISQIALQERMDWRSAVKDFPRAFSQIIVMVISLLGLIALISLPASCLLSVITMSGFSAAQLMLFIFAGILIWLLFPLILTPQAIIMRKKTAFAALKNSLKITRMTLPTTVMLFAIIFLISEGLDILWRIPEENSWLAFLGVLGHAFITTSLLTATFIYYQDAEKWVQSIFRKMLLSSTAR